MEDLEEKNAPSAAVRMKTGARPIARKPPKKRKPAPRTAKDDESDGPHPHNQSLGKRGEDAASRFLERRGFIILDRNWTCTAGEVDIVAEDDGAIVFIEVKTRSNCDKGLPEEAVDTRKRRRYEKIAGFYLREHEVGEKAVRFDVISILVVASDRAFLRHHRSAFAFEA